MDINEYDGLGRTPLMNAAIEGDLDEVRRLLTLGADPDKKDRSFGTTKAAHFAGRLASKSETHRQIHELLASMNPTTGRTEIQGAVEVRTSIRPLDADQQYKSTWPYETIGAITGRHVTRVRSSVFYLGGIASLIIGIQLVSNGQSGGGFLILFLAPCLWLYPAIRFLFGGEDSVAAAVTTVVVEELLKNEVRKVANKGKRRGR